MHLGQIGLDGVLIEQVSLADGGVDSSYILVQAPRVVDCLILFCWFLDLSMVFLSIFPIESSFTFIRFITDLPFSYLPVGRIETMRDDTSLVTVPLSSLTFDF